MRGWVDGWVGVVKHQGGGGVGPSCEGMAPAKDSGKTSEEGGRIMEEWRIKD